MTVAVQADSTRDGRTGKVTFLAIVASAAMIAGSLVFTPSARAESVADDGLVTTEEIAAALQNIGGDLVKEPVAASATHLESTPTGPEGTESAPLEVGIPTAAAEGVSLSVGDFALDIGLPNAGDAGEGQLLADGSVAYPSDGASANAVIPTDGGVQLLSIIESSDASEDYAYELSLPAGHQLEATADGGAQIVDEQGAAKVVFEPAWAQDAAGQSVPTHYSVEGNTLTQVVEHKDLAGVSYPIVTDPLPVVVIVITTVAMIVVAALALGVATWLVVNWWNVCRAQGKYPELSTKNGFTARCVY